MAGRLLQNSDVNVSHGTQDTFPNVGDSPSKRSATKQSDLRASGHLEFQLSGYQNLVLTKLGADKFDKTHFELNITSFRRSFEAPCAPCSYLSQTCTCTTSDIRRDS